LNGSRDADEGTLSGGNTDTNGGTFDIGNNAGNDRAFPGFIQEVRLSNSARYTGATYTIPTARFTVDANTIGLWHCDEGAGTSVADSGVNGLTGTLAGTVPTWRLKSGHLSVTLPISRTAAGTRTAV
jgi:hypothetical protein